MYDTVLLLSMYYFLKTNILSIILSFSMVILSSKNYTQITTVIYIIGLYNIYPICDPYTCNTFYRHTISTSLFKTTLKLIYSRFNKTAHNLAYLKRMYTIITDSVMKIK